MYELFMLFFFIIGMPVLVAMIQNYYDEKRRSRKRDRTGCPPHKWILIIDDIANMHDILICEKCGYRNKFNN